MFSCWPLTQRAAVGNHSVSLGHGDGGKAEYQKCAELVENLHPTACMHCPFGDGSKREERKHKFLRVPTQVSEREGRESTGMALL